MDVSLDYYYRHNENFLSIIYLWPYQDRKYLIMKRAVLIIFVVFTCFTQIAAMFTYRFNQSIIFEMIPIHVTSMSILISIISLYTNDASMKKLWDNIQIDLINSKDKIEYELKKSYGIVIDKLSRCLITLYMIGVASFLFISTLYPRIMDIIVPLNESRPYSLPFKISLCIIDEEEFYLVYLLIMQTGGIVLAFVGTAIHITFWSQMIHLFGQIQLTGDGLKAIFQNIKNDNTYLLNEIFHSSLICCVQRHQRVLKYRLLIQSCFSIPASTVVVSFVIVLTLTIIQLSIVGTSDIKVLFQLVVSLPVMYIHFWFGQHLTNSAAKVVNELYFTEWYRVSPKIRKQLVSIIFQAHKPLTLNAFKLYSFSFVNMREILKLVVSYYTVLNNVRQI